MVFSLLLPWCLPAVETSTTSPAPVVPGQYWSNETPRRPDVPEPRLSGRIANPIDAFILHHLDPRGLKPSNPAPKRTLLRRLSLDVTGLPPTPKEVRTFVINVAEDAYEAEVNRLLASERFGERMAQVWLDAVRYERFHDGGTEAAYRAYVIGAFNRNTPFDRFTEDQLTGSRETSTKGALPGSAALFGGQESGCRDDVNGRAVAKRDMAPLKVRTLSEAWLGATLACAQCHDHPYDPFGKDDFHRMAAFFSGAGEAGEGGGGSGDAVRPGFPRCLNGGESGERKAETLADLARWLTWRGQPRTARVFVNRMWKEFFGTGISKVVDDLGGGSEWPVHPELLDWLAVEFMESGWDVKHMIRLMVTSFTYRQSSIPTRESLEKDPGNRWLGSQSPRPLDTAGMRDNALFLGGLLKEDIAGPSFRPFNLWDLLEEWDEDTDGEPSKDVDAHHRRSLYMEPGLKRGKEMMRDPADGSDAGACPFSKAPPMPWRGDPLSDPIYLEASRGFAQRLLGVKGSDADRIREAFEWAMVRPAERGEIKSLERVLKTQRGHYKGHPEEAVALLAMSRAPFKKDLEPREWAAWIEVCRVILNLEETYTRY